MALSVSLMAQSAKKYFKTAEKFKEAKEYPSAITNYTKAIDLDPDLVDAYVSRGESYMAEENNKEAIRDFEKAIALDIKSKKELYLKIGMLQAKEKEYDKAVEAYNQAAKQDKKYFEPHLKKTALLLDMGKYNSAKESADYAIALDDKNPWAYYYRGKAQYNLELYKDAKSSFQRAIALKSRVKYFHLALAETLHKMGGDERAMFDQYKKVIYLDPNDPEAYTYRGIAYRETAKYTEAIDDLTKAITLDPEYLSAFLNRGLVYFKTGKYQDAINDFTKVIVLDSEYAKAYYHRGASYQQMNEPKRASQDYKLAIKYAGDDKELAVLLKEAKGKMYELNRELDKPEIVIENLVTKGTIIEIPDQLKTIVVKGKIKDASNIKSIIVDGNDATFSVDTINPSFQAEVKLTSSTSLVEIKATDVYDNTTATSYKVKRTETNLPVVKLLAPYASDNNEVYLDADNPEIYVEGKIKDASLIRSIVVEGANAGFSLTELNPAFSAKINITNKASFSVIVEDIYGNKSENEYKIKREGVDLADNPMGKTWVVFIENADYKDFANLKGPTNDVAKLKNAFAGYKFSNIIHKRNMSKAEMEKFFAIELRDLIRTNRVKSLLVWYAGHGKYLFETGYWIPVDAKNGEEFTYYSVSALKAALQGYKDVVHTLVISDACETGDAFLLAMRGSGKKVCDDWKATTLNSSQALTSAGLELASDESIFTKTFVNILNGNKNKCIPIQDFVAPITSAVTANQQQKPKFGPIKGLNHNPNGTFFFIRR